MKRSAGQERTNGTTNKQSDMRWAGSARVGDRNFGLENAWGVRRGLTGFTLIELLVAMMILLILATLTFTMMNVTTKGDQIRAAARQVQSYIEGARDRAIHANEVRGVRFLRDPNAQNMVTSMVFVGSPGRYAEGTIQVGDPADATDYFRVTPSASGTWDELLERGQIGNGAEISIKISGQANMYTMVREATSSGTFWSLTKAFTGSLNTALEYELVLNPTVLPNQEPRLLPSGIVIDLTTGHSRVPSTWTTTGATAATGSLPGNSGSSKGKGKGKGAGKRARGTVATTPASVPQPDVLFSPRGPVSGTLTSFGNIHLLLADVRDVDRGLGALDRDLDAPPDGIQEDERNIGEKLIVTITPQTGKVATHPIYYDVNDVFRYAETGEEAK